VLVHEDGPRGVDAAQIRTDRGNDGSEVALRCHDGLRSTLPCPLGLSGIGLHDDDLPPGELEWPCMDPREADLEYAARPVPQELEDLRGRACSESWRQPSHTETLTFVNRGASRRG
jgi:hypothetical protein